MYVEIGSIYFDEVSFFNKAIVLVGFINNEFYVSKEILLSDLDPMSYELTLIDEEDDEYRLFRKYEFQFLYYPSNIELILITYKF